MKTQVEEESSRLPGAWRKSVSTLLRTWPSVILFMKRRFLLLWKKSRSKLKAVLDYQEAGDRAVLIVLDVFKLETYLIKSLEELDHVLSIWNCYRVV